MKKHVVIIIITLLLLTSGCLNQYNDNDSYSDTPKDIRDGSLDYQDYKEADCPHLGESLDQETMKKCNEWIRNNSDTT